MANWITKSWQAYIRWCDRMGLTPENRRCCMPRLEDPPLVSKRSSCLTEDKQVSSPTDKTSE
ncbi:MULTISPECIES: hypothetical protein [Shewanella]|jgi:hypothetical protein|uniref:Uncharacterized protein n=1 Tax=Shewanella putrefaciens (strain CN-32 / ATCC BAA-453) TaxID=319224 RepID=A4Y9B2_SHEPC|nr:MULTISPECIES: hypothetical protein [Shewanella]ABM24028.1 conserved hypothetical protein [Shewanella sp. W3-18-1]QGS49075.1 hypothetical protein FOB89_09195 [Shewanella putrefaciens]